MNKQDFIWINLLKKGDPFAFRQLYDAYHHLVFRYSYAFIKSREMAEEAVQEVFCKVWEKRESLNPDLSFQSFLCTIAKNYLLNQLRKASYDAEMRQKVFYARAKQEAVSEDLLIHKELQGAKEAAIDKLPFQRKKIFLMSYQNGMKHKEIAVLLGISKNTVKDQIVKAKKDIKQYLAKYADIAFTLITLLFYKS